MSSIAHGHKHSSSVGGHYLGSGDDVPAGHYGNGSSSTNNCSATGGKQKKTHIQVVVRCRSLNERELRDNPVEVVHTPAVQGREVILKGATERRYKFDRVFGPQADQELIHREIVMPIINEMLQGYNCTIFAYGQTGTGKTYTMEGDLKLDEGGCSDLLSQRSASRMGSVSDASRQRPPLSVSDLPAAGYDPNELDLAGIPARAGIIPRTLRRLFMALDRMSTEYSVRVSYIEIYNEELRDLLSSSYNPDAPNGGTDLQIFGDSSKKGGLLIRGLEEVPVSTAKDAIAAMSRGAERRRVAVTKCNQQSSRSHAIFSIMVNIREPSMATSADGEQLIKFGKLNLVDLAGSENVRRSGAEDMRLREAAMINKSLLNLGRVIKALVEHEPHVPYRDSKLTRLLQDSLGGSTRTCLIATISPARVSLEETQSTLDYAFRAKNVCNQPQINQQVTKSILINELNLQITRLKAELEATRDKNGICLPQSLYEELTRDADTRREQIREWSQRLELREEELRRMHTENQQMRYQWEATEERLELANQELKDKSNRLESVESKLAETLRLLNEQRVLTAAHAETEAELDYTAKKLSAYLDDAGPLGECLCDEIDRMVAREHENMDRADEYSSQLLRRTGGMAKRVSQATSGLEKQTAVLISKLEDDVGERFEGALRKEIDAWSSRVRDTLTKSVEASLGQLDSSASLHGRISEELGKACASLRVTIDQSIMDTLDHCRSLKQMVETLLENHKTTLLSISDGIVQHITEGIQETQRHRESQHRRLNSLVAGVIKAMSSQAEQASKGHSGLKGSVQCIKAQIESDDARLIRQIQSLIEERQAQQMALLQNLVESSGSNAVLLQKAAEEVSTTSARCQEETGQADKRAIEFEASLIDTVQSKLRQAARDAYGQATEMAGLLDSSTTKIHEAAKHQSEQTAEFMRGTVAQRQQLSQAFDQVRGCAGEQLKAIASVAAESVDHGAKLVEDAAGVWQEARTEIYQSLGAARAQLLETGSALSADIESVNELSTSTFAKIKATIPANTFAPQRERLPKRLKSWRRTRPHEVITKRLRTDVPSRDGRAGQEEDGDAAITMDLDDLAWTGEHVQVPSPRTLRNELASTRVRPTSIPLPDSPAVSMVSEVPTRPSSPIPTAVAVKPSGSESAKSVSTVDSSPETLVGEGTSRRPMSALGIPGAQAPIARINSANISTRRHYHHQRRQGAQVAGQGVRSVSSTYSPGVGGDFQRARSVADNGVSSSVPSDTETVGSAENISPDLQSEGGKGVKRSLNVPALPPASLVTTREPA
ncbi:Kinesin- motor protein, partial [Spiromyces aspiralis]